MRLPIILAIVLCSSVVITSEAQGQLFKGDLIRKIFGEEDRNRNQNSQAAERQRERLQQQRSRSNYGNTGQPTPARQPYAGGNSNSRSNSSSSNSQNRYRSSGSNYSRTTPSSSSSSSSRLTSNSGKGVSFGARLQKTRGGVAISQLVRDGVASNASFKSGDVITNFGGIEVVEIADVDSILEILGQGDQIEVAFTRNGKADKKIVQFGELDESAYADRAPAADADRSESSRYQVRDPNQWGDSNSEDYARVQAPTFGSNSRDSSSSRSVMDSLHTGSSPTPSIRPSSSSEVRQLQSIIEQQQDAIESLQRELQILRSQSSGSEFELRGPTVAPSRGN